ncbi:phosphoglycerate mutase [Thiocystis violacea]|uniref:phosphoglycerate mutase n=1 Tax=Thiocystis violacea TaxID=13725 RepID=UPI00190354AF|nr:phosphoglycerate mutase [Thiocystis violacea]MBK1723755.1 hypothetical protein [Thiocystis violacea]
MSDPTPDVTLICPGLLGPVPLIPRPFPKTPVLSRWLARGRPAAGTTLDPYLACLRAGGVATDPERDVPTGPLSLLGEEPETLVDGFWMRADPVHLRPDRDQLRVFSGEALLPTREEADALIDAFNAHFAGDGLHLLAPVAGRWYLRVQSDPELRTTPLHQVLGDTMAPHLPEGPGAREWMRLMNEAQMLFHASPVNRRRESQGRPMINGLWTWGGGLLPTLAQQPPALMIGDHPLIAGLARLGGGRHLQADLSWERAVSSAQPALVFIDSLWSALIDRDLDGWLRGLAELEGRVAELDGRLRRGEVVCVELVPCLGTTWTITAKRLRYLWRRGGLVQSLVVGAGAQD